MSKRFQAILSNKSLGLKGQIYVPSDKSISHRALILGSLAVGKTSVSGLLESDDVFKTANGLKALGVDIYKESDHWCVHGVGIGGFCEPDDIIDCGNSGTSVRLLMGLVSTCPIKVTFTGDDSLRKRPMDRVISPLSYFGATFSSNYDCKLPINVIGSNEPVPISFNLKIPSAQVKSAILLAGLNVRGKTTVLENEPTRDHTEKMLQHLGAKIQILKKGSSNIISVSGFPKLNPSIISVPGDISSAAFPIALACMVPNSEIIVKNVGLNPLRDGFIETLIEMGANIKIKNKTIEAGELVADLHVSYSPNLKGVEVPKERSARMIDEYPILSILAATAKGPTIMMGVEELRFKESDRIEAIVDGLGRSGISTTQKQDQLTVFGKENQKIKGGSIINASNDHRIAMSFASLGSITEKSIEVRGASSIKTSFPNFIELMNSIGLNIITLND
ncbi:MAG: 3-phosphoshikimate 1-carboxyvinyltransferase [Paracoccaceae bacterium]